MRHLHRHRVMLLDQDTQDPRKPNFMTVTCQLLTSSALMILTVGNVLHDDVTVPEWLFARLDLTLVYRQACLVCLRLQRPAPVVQTCRSGHNGNMRHPCDDVRHVC